MPKKQIKNIIYDMFKYNHFDIHIIYVMVAYMISNHLSMSEQNQESAFHKCLWCESQEDSTCKEFVKGNSGCLCRDRNYAGISHRDW